MPAPGHFEPMAITVSNWPQLGAQTTWNSLQNPGKQSLGVVLLTRRGPCSGHPE